MSNLTPDDAALSPSETNTTTGTAKQMLDDAGRAVRQEASQFASTAQDKARGAIDRQKQTATRTLGDFADAVRKAGDELGARDQSMASNLVRQAADSLENLSRTLADNGPDELIENVRDFGRRNPAAFLGGALLVGLAIGRFARSSAHAEDQYGYGRTNQFSSQNDWIDEDADDVTAGIGASSLGATGAAGASLTGSSAGVGSTGADLYSDDLASGDILTAEGGDFTPRDPAASDLDDDMDSTGERRTTGLSGDI